MTVLFFFLGLGLLVAGGELLVRGASRLAFLFGISPLVVGLTVVAFGTSAPELAVSVQSVLSGKVDLALGNVVGSNIFNVLLILGLSALIVPLIVARQLIRQEVPVMIAASVLLMLLAIDGGLSRGDGALLFGLLIVYLGVTLWQALREPKDTDADDEAPVTGWAAHWATQIVFVIVGVGLLVLGANWLVDAAVAFARILGVSELVIGLTIVAAGTSLPEVATSVIAAVRGERDIAVGNVVGSNIFNILAVLGATALVAPSALVVSPAILAFDLPFMIAVAFACLPIFFTGSLITRWEGALFLAAYVAYTVYIVLAASKHEALPAYSTTMFVFVLPLVALTVAILAAREWHRSR